MKDLPGSGFDTITEREKAFIAVFLCGSSR